LECLGGQHYQLSWRASDFYVVLMVVMEISYDVSCCHTRCGCLDCHVLLDPSLSYPREHHICQSFVYRRCDVDHRSVVYAGVNRFDSCLLSGHHFDVFSRLQMEIGWRDMVILSDLERANELVTAIEVMRRAKVKELL